MRPPEGALRGGGEARRGPATGWDGRISAFLLWAGLRGLSPHFRFRFRSSRSRRCAAAPCRPGPAACPPARMRYLEPRSRPPSQAPAAPPRAPSLPLRTCPRAPRGRRCGPRRHSTPRAARQLWGGKGRLMSQVRPMPGGSASAPGPGPRRGASLGSPSRPAGGVGVSPFGVPLCKRLPSFGISEASEAQLRIL